MIDINEVLKIHQLLIEHFGGTTGVRDNNLLESALSRPIATFDGKDLYISIEEKAAAIIESIVTNHPFIDGNKRTGYVIMRLFLLKNGNDIKATQKEKYEFVIAISSGKLHFKEILDWIKKHIIPFVP